MPDLSRSDRSDLPPEDAIVRRFQCWPEGDEPEGWPRVYVDAQDYNRLREAARDLYEQVQMAESVGVCLPDRVPCLRLGEVLFDA